MFGLNQDEMKNLLYELDYRWGELMGNGDTEQANRLASITDKIRGGIAEDTKALQQISNAVSYESRNLDESSFETDEQYHWAVGHTDGLSDAIRILRGENWKEVVNYEQ